MNLFPADCKIRVGFNSLGAFASVNHLHFQFWNIGEENPGLPIESTPVKSLAVKGMGRVKINEIIYDYYPLHGLQYEINLDNEQFEDALYSDLEHMARSIFSCIEYLQRKNIAHNLVMIPGFPYKIFLVPRKNEGAFEDWDGFATLPGFPEVSSHLMLIHENEWSDMTVSDVWNAWREISIDDDKWMEIVKECDVGYVTFNACVVFVNLLLSIRSITVSIGLF